jgi:calcineurin-like phosphoesterase family protein
MAKTWFIFDTHFNHANMLKFKRADGTRLRPFANIEHHDTTLFDNWNKNVQWGDLVYVGGDFFAGKQAPRYIHQLNGKKILIKGNHDKASLSLYSSIFEDVVSVVGLREHKIIVSHYPIHRTSLLGAYAYNFHGHTHSALVKAPDGTPDLRYINGCVEHTNWAPVDLEWLIEQRNHRQQTREV